MLTVKDLMHEALYTLKPEDTVHQARQIMIQHHIRHLPVLDMQGHFAGLVTKQMILSMAISDLADVSEAERNALEATISVEQVAMHELDVAYVHTPLLQAAEFMLSSHIGCLPVLQGKKLVGLLTESDFVRLAVFLLKTPEEEVPGAA